MRDPLIRAALSAILPCLLGFLLIAVSQPSAQAETKPPAAFGAQAQQSPPSAFAPAPPAQAQGAFGSLMNWVMQTQQKLHRQLADSVKRLKDGNALTAALALAGLSFVYGVLHAVGPGHGKAIISSYVIANEETVRRGVLISFIAAGLQALTAIVLVSVLLIGFNATGLELNAWAYQLESVSYALIAAVGLYLLVTQSMHLWRRRQTASNPGAHGDHHHEHHHDSHDHHGHHHHVHDESCGHVVDARQVAGPFSWRKVMAVVFSVGIRPCTGAILVLVFALAQGLFWAGVAATFAMALGTAITVAALATLALGSRELALKLGGGNSGWTEAVWTMCAIGGALVIFLMGTLLFIASLGPVRPF
ncbi:MAG: nickel/cobalt transporter [Alphaproteobacteria bacterium]|nr:nickel/cobalt transporter [Alphaproteobacteria bacterium]